MASIAKLFHLLLVIQDKVQISVVSLNTSVLDGFILRVPSTDSMSPYIE